MPQSFVGQYTRYLANQDLEDIVALVNGRPNIVEEFQSADLKVRGFVRQSIAELLSRRGSLDAPPGLVLDSGESPPILGRV